MAYRCDAEADEVYRAAVDAARSSSGLHALRPVEPARTIEAVVRNFRGIPLRVWIQVVPPQSGKRRTSTVLIRWPQGMESLNDPDLQQFVEAFGERQRQRHLGCDPAGLDTGP